MLYWLLITTEGNWGKIKEKNIWGSSQRYRNTIGRMKIGDKCLIYLIQKRTAKHTYIDPKIVGEYVVDSDIFQDTKKIFEFSEKIKSDEVFPYRVKIKKQRIFKNPIDFKPLINSLNFIENKQFWSTHLQGSPMKEVSKRDYDFIISKGF